MSEDWIAVISGEKDRPNRARYRMHMHFDDRSIVQAGRLEYPINEAIFGRAFRDLPDGVD